MNDTKPPAIGLNMMNCRKLKNISLDELSKRSGVSKSMLSQIEQNKSNPTVLTVWKIARALDVPVEELIESAQDYQIEVVRYEDLPVMYSEDKSCTIMINSPIHMTDNLELYCLSFKPHGKLSSMPHYPKSQEFLTALNGQFRVTCKSSSLILRQGDTARYNADQKHEIENMTHKDANAYLVVWFPK